MSIPKVEFPKPSGHKQRQIAVARKVKSVIDLKYQVEEGLLNLRASSSTDISQQKIWGLRGQWSRYSRGGLRNQQWARLNLGTEGLQGCSRQGLYPWGPYHLVDPAGHLVLPNPWCPNPLPRWPLSDICCPHKAAHSTDVQGDLLGFELQSAPSTTFCPVVPVFSLGHSGPSLIPLPKTDEADVISSKQWQG